jgi:predicted ATPase/transcriptional regulator with XRE-family HTH domain
MTAFLFIVEQTPARLVTQSVTKSDTICLMTLSDEGLEEHFSFGYWVRRRRKALDLTQVELGRRVNASAAMIRKIEADERRPSLELAEYLARELAVEDADREAFLKAARGIASARPPSISIAPVALPPHNLPAPVTSLVNRVAALEEITALLRRNDVRLLTLIGPPGIGKTRMSIRAGREILSRFADGVWFVDLSTEATAVQMMPAIALALRLTPAPGLPLLQQVITALSEKRLLLVLDNLEQIVEGAALEIAHLLRACEGLKVLATSRIRLDIYSEHEYYLPPMSLPPAADDYNPQELLAYEAVQLFLDRARQHRPEFSLTEETAVSVADICRQVDGFPLGLELAAARTRRLPVRELATALGEASGRDWHTLLRSTARDLPPRQKTLWSAVAWSYSLLDVEEQAFLRMLGVFAGGFDVAAAAEVCLGLEEGFPFKAESLLTALEDHSLISLESEGPSRWRLLDMIREFARAQQTDNEASVARQRHLHYFAQQLRPLNFDWFDPQTMATVERDLVNYREALNTALALQDAAGAYQLVSELAYFWEAHGLLQEGRAFQDRVLSLPGEVEPVLRYAVLHQACNLAWMQHDFSASETWAAQAMVHTERYGLQEEKADLLNMLGRVYLEQARYQEADDALLESIALGRNLPPSATFYFAIIQRAEVALALGRLDEAQVLTREGLASLSEEERIPFAVGWNNLAEIALARGDAVEAWDALRRVLPLASIHSRRLRFFLLSFAGLLLVEVQDVQMAVRLLGAVEAANERLGDPLSPFGQAKLEERIALSRTILAEITWQECWFEGRRWSLDDALEAARPSA